MLRESVVTRQMNREGGVCACERHEGNGWGGGVDVKLHSLLTSTLGAVERSPSFPGCFTRGEADLGFFV